MKLSTEKLFNYRAEKYRLNPSQQLNSLQEAVDFVNERGFVHFWPITAVELPSLWTAVAGNRPVANGHDDPGHVTWGWKDESLGKNLWYYGKILRKKATMIALDVAPYFYALSRNYGDPEEDILIDFYDGLLTNEAKRVFEVVRKNGPMDTIAIRKATAMTTRQSNSPFDRAITYLQSDFKILPVGISDSGGWRYAFIYDLVHRHFPDLPIKAQQISERHARCYLLECYFTSVGAAAWTDITKLFQWGRKNTAIAIEDLLIDGKIVQDIEFPSQAGKWFALESVLA
jgi:hypothetical protein